MVSQTNRPEHELKHERTGPYRYYLEDHPFLAPLVTLVLGGLCLFAVGTNMLMSALVGPDPSRTALDQYYTAMGWTIAFVLGIMVLAFIFLMLVVVEEIIRRVRRRPATCPDCGITEVRRYLPFSHRRVPGTDWELVTCPRCGANWYARR